jgi:hypothetical protein
MERGMVDHAAKVLSEAMAQVDVFMRPPVCIEASRLRNAALVHQRRGEGGEDRGPFVLPETVIDKPRAEAEVAPRMAGVIQPPAITLTARRDG